MFGCANLTKKTLSFRKAVVYGMERVDLVNVWLNQFDKESPFLQENGNHEGLMVFVFTNHLPHPSY